MAYFVNLFSPETHRAFTNSDRTATGFSASRLSTAQRIQTADVFVCYLTVVSRWCGLLEVVDGPYRDDTPIFFPSDDPYVIRFHVRPLVWLAVENSIPVHEPAIWEQLSFTRNLEHGSLAWVGRVRASLARLADEDGQVLTDVLNMQAVEQRVFELDDASKRKIETHRVNRADKVVTVSVPEKQDESETSDLVPTHEVRESHQIQALLAGIGAQMGMAVWIPPNDRTSVLAERPDVRVALLERLPLNYDTTTLRTIEQIDVLWIRGRYIVRAFEVEHTTSVYSGILRMADLLALQPNVDIKLHIVAPLERRDKVLQEIRRPVFSLLEKGPLAESCTYISYDSLRELASQKHLAHFSDSVLDEYAEGEDE
ncbi:hypothetical protein LJ655_18555 [Paraburkholderia sp. MMS20-SJTN17]|uniref:Uncharacterized protein n=1 Tax=Paraburkholderia translucens TaxID=2886945 RepID=A0ABS8KGG9_9BURK|nr:hypothetical protein [Paraburkholderia sp. MMS20-SJTN17]MCC8403867.1 hypothetical protein [Paraburkholderia sp. MMS20-SJTN17]